MTEVREMLHHGALSPGDLDLERVHREGRRRRKRSQKLAGGLVVGAAAAIAAVGLFVRSDGDRTQVTSRPASTVAPTIAPTDTTGGAPSTTEPPGAAPTETDVRAVIKAMWPTVPVPSGATLFDSCVNLRTSCPVTTRLQQELNRVQNNHIDHNQSPMDTIVVLGTRPVGNGRVAEVEVGISGSPPEYEYLDVTVVANSSVVPAADDVACTNNARLDIYSTHWVDRQQFCR
jgi:hypothetical protein